MSEKLSERLKKILSLDNDIEDGLETLQDKCGIFGCIANGIWPTNLDVAHIICLGLVGLQHRGQESAGIVTCKWTHEPFSVHRGMGLVSQVFNEPIMMTLKGNLGIGHNRYSTMGGADNVQLAQPFMVHTSYGPIAMAHNGELVNSQALRERILRNGVGLTTGSDTELITQALSMEPPQQFKQFNFERSNSLTNCDKCGPNGHPIGSPIGSHGNIVERDYHSSTQTTINPYAQHHMLQRDSDFVARVLHLMSLTPLSYSLIVMWEECIYAIRDPFGNRPLCLGALVSSTSQFNTKDLLNPNKVDGWVVSSESCSFPSVCAKLYRDVMPGEIIKLEKNKNPKTLAIVPRPEAAPPAFCIFEYVYFARPDSMMEGQMVYSVRQKCGRQLAIEAPVLESDVPFNGVTNGEISLNPDDYIVAPVPESSIPAALGYAQETKLPYVEVFCKNRYVGRSFIQPSIKLRRLAVAKKFGPLSQNFVGKSIILIDDSIVRGTTIGQLIRLLKDAGAKEVHIRIASPPLHFPCYMGINIPTKEELVANHLKAEQLAQTLGAASLVYLSVEGLKNAVQSGIREELLKEDDKYDEDDLADRVGHCTACLTGQYPVKLTGF